MRSQEVFAYNAQFFFFVYDSISSYLINILEEIKQGSYDISLASGVQYPAVIKYITMRQIDDKVKKKNDKLYISASSINIC